MMIPSLLILRLWERPGIPVIVPLFLLWPFLLLGGLALGVAMLFKPHSDRARGILAVTTAFLAMRGLLVDVRDADGSRVYCRIV